MSKVPFFLTALVLANLAVSPGEQKSECQTKRESAQRTIKDIEASGRGSALAIVVPNCTPEGDYANLQCHHSTNFCACWDKEGIPVTQPKKNLNKCSCLMDRAAQLKRIPPSQTDSSDITSCEPNGLYTAKQCNRSACWCVNPSTGKKLSSESRDKSAVKC